MGLIRKLLGGRKDDAAAAADAAPASSALASSQFAESQSTMSPEKVKSRNAMRRDLAKMMLRETMRKHGIPSDWIECRALSVLTRQHKQGLHVQFIVCKADQQLLPYIHAFQESFWEEILKTDPQAREWLLSVGWEFRGASTQGFSATPQAGAFDAGDTESMEGDTLPPDDADVVTDLQALQALMSAPAELAESPEAPEPKPRKHKAVS